MKRQPFVISALLMVILSACSRPSPAQQQQDVIQLSQSFKVLERLQVQDYRNQDWCKNIAYRRGKFSDNREAATCNLFAGTPLPFDAQAQQDFKAIAQAITATGVELYYINNIKYGPQGTLLYAEFHLADSPNHYVYTPNYKQLPDDIPNQTWHSVINQNWYYVREDWN